MINYNRYGSQFAILKRYLKLWQYFEKKLFTNKKSCFLKTRYYFLVAVFMKKCLKFVTNEIFEDRGNLADFAGIYFGGLIEIGCLFAKSSKIIEI